MGLYFFFGALTLTNNLNDTNFLAGIGQNQTLFHTTYRSQTFGIRTGFYGLKHSKISQIEDKYLCLQDYNASVRLDFDCLDFTFAASLYDTFKLG